MTEHLSPWTAKLSSVGRQTGRPTGRQGNNNNNNPTALPSLDLSRLRVAVSKASLTLGDLIEDTSPQHENVYLTISSDFPPQQRLESYAPPAMVAKSADSGHKKTKLRHSSEKSALDGLSRVIRGHEKKGSTASCALSQTSSVSSSDEAFVDNNHGHLYDWRKQTFEM